MSAAFSSCPACLCLQRGDLALRRNLRLELRLRGVIRVDLAYALNRGPAGGRWVLSVRGGHAFSLWGSSSRDALGAPDAVLTDANPGSRHLRR